MIAGFIQQGLPPSFGQPGTEIRIGLAGHPEALDPEAVEIAGDTPINAGRCSMRRKEDRTIWSFDMQGRKSISLTTDLRQQGGRVRDDQT